MPRRKPNQLKGEAREKREIQMRLMQISLRVDDHIYKNNPITPDIAESYFQEVSALRLRCHQDRRILQVIEKLTREMRQIVLENTEQGISVSGTAAQQRSNGFCTITESTGFMDLCVDDMTVRENKNAANNDIAEISRTVSSISVREIESQSIFNNNEYNIGHEHYSCGQGFEEYEKIATISDETNNTLMMTLDLPSQIENRTSNTEKTKNIFLPAQKDNKYATNSSSVNTTLKNSNNIETPDKNNYNKDAVSGISVSDIESQSILKINEYNIGHENYSCRQGFQEYEKIATVPYETNNTLMTTHDLQSQIENRATNTEKENNIFLPAQKDNKYATNSSSVNTTLKNSNNIETPGKNNYNTESDAVVNKRKLVKNDALNSNEDYIINKSAGVVGANKTSNKKAITKKGKFKPPSKNNTNIKEKKLNKHLSTSNTKNEMTTVKDPKNTKDKVKTISQDMNEAILNPQTSNFAIKEKIGSKKSTENVANEMDLSWVENIKYVRQIDKEEYNNNMNITETFWNTCEFPSDWNESEFNN